MPQPRRRTLVLWDLPLRLFHWSLVLLVSWCWISGFLLPASWRGSHLWAGGLIAVLLLFRLVWGLFGSEYSRWSQMPLAPKRLLQHIRSLLQGEAEATPGHPPAGAAMIVVLLLLLTGLLVSGVVTLGGVDKQGPLRWLLTFAEGRSAREIHEGLAVALLFAVAVHLVGVVTESLLLNSNLVAAMLHGRKTVLIASLPGVIRSARPKAALITLAPLLLLAGGGLFLLSGKPPLGWVMLTDRPEAYDRECGACHDAYHPSLRTAEGWMRIMAGLSLHFGEDAGLPLDLTADLTQWLIANSAEHWDTKVANGVGRALDPVQPERLTSTVWWKRRHRDLPDGLFRQKNIMTASNCSACHQDAIIGRFTGQAIHIPDPPVDQPPVAPSAPAAR